METSCMPEAVYLLGHALRKRGFAILENDRLGYKVGTPTVRFGLNFLPGNRRTLVSHSSFVEPESRGKGIGKAMLKLRELIAREVGATLLLATVKNDNDIEMHLLETHGWKRFTENRETATSLWGKEL